MLCGIRWENGKQENEKTTKPHQTPQGEEMFGVLRTRGQYNFSLAQEKVESKVRQQQQQRPLGTMVEHLRLFGTLTWHLAVMM